MSPAIRESLEQVFNFADFRAGQEPVIRQLMQGNSALAVFPTGSGKSLCYQLPAIHLPGLTLVISPLIALMKDQIDFLQGRGVAAARLDSSLNLEEFRDVWRQVDAGTLKLLYVSPERFKNEKFVAKLERVRISMMVVDEAHCMSEWGHNFRPDYLKLAQLAKQFKVERVLALTATATPQVAADVCRQFAIAPDAYVNIGYHRPNLELHLTPATLAERNKTLLARLKSRPQGAAIVYVTQQQTSEDVAAYLSENGIPAAAYHAGLDPERRSLIQERFMAAPNGVVVATIAFGMGIDKADIRYVYHLNLPKSLENYAQEIGRAGRDGKPALCEAFINEADRVILENFVYGDTPDLAAVNGLVRFFCTSGGEFDVSTYELSQRFDVRPLVIGTLVCYLELEGVIQSTGAFFDQYKYQFLTSQADVLGRFDPARQQFLRDLFAQAKVGRTWCTLDIEKTIANLKTTRKRIIAALDYLEQQGLLQSQASGFRQGYRLLQPNIDPQVVADRLHTRFADAETREIKRIRQLAEFAKSPACITRELLRYFGEELPQDCGHCDRCLGSFNNNLPEQPLPTLTPQHADIIRAVRSENHAALASPRQLAKFLCGITSPAASRSRPSLSKHPQFGILSNHPFAAVLQHCQA